MCLRLFWNVEIKILRNWRQKQQKKKKTTEFVLDNKLRITKKRHDAIVRNDQQKKQKKSILKVSFFILSLHTHTHKYRVLNNRKEKRKKRGRRDLSSCDLVCLCIYVWKKNSYAFLMKDQKRKEKKWIEGNK